MREVFYKINCFREALRYLKWAYESGVISEDEYIDYKMAVSQAIKSTIEKMVKKVRELADLKRVGEKEQPDIIGARVVAVDWIDIYGFAIKIILEKDGKRYSVEGDYDRGNYVQVFEEEKK